MEIEGKVVVITGGASGIGRALAERLASGGAAGMVISDLDEDGATEVAASLEQAGTRAIAVHTDVAVEADMAALVERTERELGAIDLFCSNAGIAIPGGADVPDDGWERIWAVNVMAHVYAARALIPRMAERGGGHLLVTASAAGLLTNLGSAPYSVTKHAAVALAEWLSITYADDGIKVSCLCPQGVRTPMLLGGIAANDPAGTSVAAAGEVLEPETVAETVAEALRDERFLVLPHPQVADYMRQRAEDPERWLRGMRRAWSQYRPPRREP